jgi:hypothetical protein
MPKVYRPRRVEPASIKRWMKGAVVLTVRSWPVWVAAAVPLILLNELRRAAPDGWIEVVVDLGILLVAGTVLLCLSDAVRTTRSERGAYKPDHDTQASGISRKRRDQQRVSVHSLHYRVRVLSNNGHPDKRLFDETESVKVLGDNETKLGTFWEFVLAMVAGHAFLFSRGVTISRWAGGPGAFSFLLSRVIGFGKWRADRVEFLGLEMNHWTLMYAYFALVIVYIGVSKVLAALGVADWGSAAINLGIGSNFLWLCFKDIYLLDDEEASLVKTRAMKVGEGRV